MRISTKSRDSPVGQGHLQLLQRVSVHFYNLSKKQTGTFIKNHENIYILAYNDHTVSFKNY